MPPPSVAEPTRLRILNCLAAGPMFVSDLQAVLGIPQPTVSRHLKILREAALVLDTPIAQFVLYRLARGTGPRERLLRAVLDGIHHDEQLKTERHQAQDRSRAHPANRLSGELTPAAG